MYTRTKDCYQSTCLPFMKKANKHVLILVLLTALWVNASQSGFNMFVNIWKTKNSKRTYYITITTATNIRKYTVTFTHTNSSHSTTSASFQMDWMCDIIKPHLSTRNQWWRKYSDLLPKVTVRNFSLVMEQSQRNIDATYINKQDHPWEDWVFLCSYS